MNIHVRMKLELILEITIDSVMCLFPDVLHHLLVK